MCEIKVEKTAQVLTQEIIKKALEDSGILYTNNGHFYGALIEGACYDDSVNKFIDILMLKKGIIS